MSGFEISQIVQELSLLPTAICFLSYEIANPEVNKKPLKPKDFQYKYRIFVVRWI